MQTDQLLPHFQDQVDQIHCDFYDAVASVGPSQCFICIRTPTDADGFQKSQNIWPLVTAFRCILALILRRKMQLDWYSYLEHWLAISLVRNTDF